jgi:hypothetical protein
MNPHDEEIEMPDPHFGTDEQMLAWCEDEKLEPVKDEDGQWDWHAVWEIYLIKLEEEDQP